MIITYSRKGRHLPMWAGARLTEHSDNHNEHGYATAT